MGSAEVGTRHGNKFTAQNLLREIKMQRAVVPPPWVIVCCSRWRIRLSIFPLPRHGPPSAAQRSQIGVAPDDFPKQTKSAIPPSGFPPSCHGGSVTRGVPVLLSTADSLYCTPCLCPRGSQGSSQPVRWPDPRRLP